MLHTSSSHSSRTPLLSRQELALIAVTMVWGGTFLVVHLAMQYSGPLFFVGLRFVTAGLIGLLVFRKAMAGLTRTELVAGIAIGASIFLGYGLQTFGLQTISSSKSAFLTALYVPLVPLLQWLVMGKPPRLMSWIGIGLAFTGLMLVAGPESGGMELNVGEMATMLSTLAIAAEVLLIGHFAGKVDARRVTTVQLLAAGTMALLAMPVAGESVPDFSWVWLTAAVAMACASILIQLTMNWAQKSLSPTRATVIYASEPVWAGIVGRMAGDRLPGLVILGAALIVGGVLVSELKWTRRKAGASTA
ncbi:DMT family transporter [Delftia acidovorans]|uniref:DMT family transporter n=1 Tax=Delftia acidovorans TaxID=80866 RepID=A0A7T2W116_DELAC|nr:DMT family transporter [Delftia acidovorans]QPS09823.1 DMT family transporter [Delftia acidovorans]